MFNTSGYSLADISAATGGANRNNDNLFGGNGAWIIIILFLFVFLGWGKNGFGNDGGSNGGGSMPTIVNLPANSGGSGYSGEIQRGFDTQNVVGKLDRLGDGICSLGYDQLSQMNGINQNISNGFHSVDNAICSLGYNVQQGFNTTNIALMQGQNALQTQLADCCCTTQRAIDGVNYNMATNTCALQNTMNNNTRDIIENANAGTREILNYLCQKENADLRDKVQRLELAASQTSQNQFITQVGSDIVNRLQPAPVPAFPASNLYAYAGNACGCNSCGC